MKIHRDVGRMPVSTAGYPPVKRANNAEATSPRITATAAGQYPLNPAVTNGVMHNKTNAPRRTPSVTEHTWIESPGSGSLIRGAQVL